MYKTLPNEDESQRQGRLQKEAREKESREKENKILVGIEEVTIPENVEIPKVLPLFETNPYITPEITLQDGIRDVLLYIKEKP